MNISRRTMLAGSAAALAGPLLASLPALRRAARRCSVPVRR